MWMWVVVFVVVVAVIRLAKRMDRSRDAQSASRRPDLPGIHDGRAFVGSARMKRGSVVVAALLFAVLGMPQTTSATITRKSPA